MKTTAKEFAELLQKSSLDIEHRMAIVKMVKGLDMKQIEKLADILRKDAHLTQKEIAEADETQKSEITNFIERMNKIKIKESKK